MNDPETIKQVNYLTTWLNSAIRKREIFNQDDKDGFIEKTKNRIDAMKLINENNEGKIREEIGNGLTKLEIIKDKDEFTLDEIKTHMGLVPANDQNIKYEIHDKSGNVDPQKTINSKFNKFYLDDFWDVNSKNTRKIFLEYWGKVGGAGFNVFTYCDPKTKEELECDFSVEGIGNEAVTYDSLLEKYSNSNNYIKYWVDVDVVTGLIKQIKNESWNGMKTDDMNKKLCDNDSGVNEITAENINLRDERALFRIFENGFFILGNKPPSEFQPNVLIKNGLEKDGGELREKYKQEKGEKFLKILLTINFKKNYFKLDKGEKEKIEIKKEQGIKYIEDNETTSYFSKKLCNSSTSMKDKPECSCNTAENEELKKLGLTDEDVDLIMNLLSPAAILSTDVPNEDVPPTQADSCPFKPKAKVQAKGGSKNKRTIKNKKSKQKNRKSKQKNRKSKKNKKSKKIKRKKYKRKSKKI